MVANDFVSMDSLMDIHLGAEATKVRKPKVIRVGLFM